MARILVPIRYAAWLSGELGIRLERTLRHGLQGLDADVARMPRGFLIESPESPGPFLEHVRRAVADLEAGAREAYPMFHREMGPLWTGTLQVLFPDPEDGSM
ncbi:MAG: hypothetical protein ACPHID_04550 [Thermoplasmatota archaeon]